MVTEDRDYTSIVRLFVMKNSMSGSLTSCRNSLTPRDFKNHSSGLHSGSAPVGNCLAHSHTQAVHQPTHPAYADKECPGIGLLCPSDFSAWETLQAHVRTLPAHSSSTRAHPGSLLAYQDYSIYIKKTKVNKGSSTVHFGDNFAMLLQL